MQTGNFTISGRVIDSQTKDGLPELRIEAWDKDLNFNDLVGSSETDRQGRFSMLFTTEYFSEIFFDQRPDLFFKVFRGETEIQPINSPFILNMRPGEIEITIEVDISSVEEPKEFVVKGTVRDETGSPQSGLLVRAVDIDLRNEQLLGETTTDSSGHYKITYTEEQIGQAEKKGADLVVRVFDTQGEILVASPTFFNAPRIATIDLQVDNSVSEFQQVYNELHPLLRIDNISLSDLTEEDISFLSGETGFEKEWLQILADSARITIEADLNLDITRNDIIALFYGLGRKGQALILYELLSQDFLTLRRMIEDALDINLIPSYLTSSLDAFFAELNRLVSEAGIEKSISRISVQHTNDTI